MSLNYTTKPSQSAGFSLIELLVAMVIGLITLVVIAQVMTVSEGQKRSATTGSDALVNGALALAVIDRDVKGAGYGMTSLTASIGCEIRSKFAGEPVRTFSLTPANITDGANGAPDTIQILASSKNGITLPTRISVDHPATAANFFVDSDVGVQVSDLMIAVPASPSSTNWCSVFQVTNTGGGGGGGQGQGQNQVLHNSGQSHWNQPGGQTIFPSGGYAKDDYLINLGQMLDHTYAINNNNLQLTEFVSTTGASLTSELFPQIVQLQAVYGKDTDNNGSVDAWNATQPTTSVGWQQIKALRVVIVARTQIMEKEVVTLAEADVGASAKCNTATANPNIVCWRPNPTDATTGVAINLNINNANPDWQRYRYRLFETTIPLRNVIWKQ